MVQPIDLPRYNSERLSRNFPPWSLVHHHHSRNRCKDSISFWRLALTAEQYPPKSAVKSSTNRHKIALVLCIVLSLSKLSLQLRSEQSTNAFKCYVLSSWLLSRSSTLIKLACRNAYEGRWSKSPEIKWVRAEFRLRSNVETRVL